ncbi:hypothetical protein ONZ43_g6973 [Nemania bipapillata]|uniref:Uncharacterized protein n=1 Tax=Nemania bipapillata TaxID=110536 RepID=A0ACC2HUF0_9PEZI|nr:hypothetical protein ONZ43_g6973 [Nemania bipapillata]
MMGSKHALHLGVIASGVGGVEDEGLGEPYGVKMASLMGERGGSDAIADYTVRDPHRLTRIGSRIAHPHTTRRSSAGSHGNGSNWMI